MEGRARVLLGFAAFGMFWGSWGALLPVVQRHAHVTDGELGLCLVLVGIGALLSLRPTGSVADRRPRVVLPCALALLGASTIGPVAARGPLGLASACLPVGVCAGAADAVVNAAGAACEARGVRVLSAGHGAFSALVVGASLVTAALLVHATGPWPLLVTGAAVLVAAVGSAVLPAAAAATPATLARRPRLRRAPSSACPTSASSSVPPPSGCSRR